MLVTQPRKIAAITIAHHVANERHTTLGVKEIGYQVGLDKQIPSSEGYSCDKILFCTTGVVLQRLIHEKSMDRYTHIIIDEVHERDVDIDFLLMVVRRLLIESPATKLILMSATMDADQFVNFFKVTFEDGSVFLPPKIDLSESARVYEIEELYLNHFEGLWLSDLNQLINYEKPGIESSMYDFAVKVINFSLRQQRKSSNLKSPAILVFLPGIHEIETLHKKLLEAFVEEFKTTHGNPSELLTPEIFILHSMLSTEAQESVFKTIKAPKIILATNIAESGVTIPNVTHVIDFCLTKYQVLAKGAQISTLILNWTSRNNCKQRAGRAGRLCQGVVVRMVSKKFYDNMNEYPAPEMQRIGLESVVIKTKLLKMGPPLELLALALDPPTKSSVVDAVLHLKELGGLSQYNDDGTFEYDNGFLTFIGEIMGALPLDVTIARFIVFGYMLGVYDEVVIIGAGLSLKSIFTQSYDDKFESYVRKVEWAHGSNSDCIAILNAYNLWQNVLKGKDKNFVPTWCNRHHLDVKHLHDLRTLVAEIHKRLETFLIRKPTETPIWEEQDKAFVLKICIAGAFGPCNFFIPDAHSQEAEREAFRLVNNQDLFRTVYFKNMNRELGEVYESQIHQAFKRKKIVQENSDMSVKFDYPNSEKVFVQFGVERQMIESEASGDYSRKILPEVFKSVHMRQLNAKLSISMMNHDETTKYAVEQGLGTMVNGTFVKNKENFINAPGWCVEPTLTTVMMHGYVTHVDHCNKFFFSPVKSYTTVPGVNDNRYEKIINEIQEMMKKADRTLAVNMTNEIRDGKFVIVQTEENLRRGYLVGNSTATRMDVYLLDYGSTLIDANADKIFFVIDQKVEQALLAYPPRIFECTLKEVQPSSLLCHEGKWTQRAIDSLKTIVGRKASIQIYSVVNDVVSVNLSIQKVVQNKRLIDEGFAEECEESYISKENHDYRTQLQLEAEVQPSKILSPEEEFSNKLDENHKPCQIFPPPVAKCMHKTTLIGPYSPLEIGLNGIARIHPARVTVDQMSVNAVMLDDDIFNFRAKFCVAVDTIGSLPKNQMTIRETTLMPNIPGLPVLLALMFCPNAELRRDETKTRYASLLTGLGFDKARQQPFYGERDTLQTLDFELTNDDIDAINQFRFCMSQMLLTEPDKKLPDLVDEDKIETMKKIRTLLLEILNKVRPVMDITPVSMNEYDWNVDQDEAVVRTDPHGARGMFQFIGASPLHEMTLQGKNDLLQHHQDLERCADYRLAFRKQICSLCNYEWQTVTELKIHLLSKKHCSRLQRLS